MVTARAAAAQIKRLLDERSVPHGKITGQTVDFTDLARAKRVTVYVAGWEVNANTIPLAQELRSIAGSNGFSVDFITEPRFRS
jgi:hypothetical protein